MFQADKPDTGYAWVVVISACIINLILSGMGRMVGILFVAIIDTYHVTREQASLPFTVRVSFRNLTGPIVGILGQRYGIQRITFLGGVFAALGSGLCCIAPTITWITIFWGLIHGLGFSMGNTLFQVVVNQYFEKYRATASGIVLSGACIGSFVLPFLLRWSLNNYGLFGCFLILAGLFFNVCPASLLLKAPPWIEKPAILTDHDKGAKQHGIENIALSFDAENSISTESISTISKDYSNTDARINSFTTFEKAKSDPSQCHKNQSKRKEQESIWSNTKNTVLLYKNPMYILINLSQTVYYLLLLPVNNVVVDYGRDKGLQEYQNTYAIYAITLGDFIGRISFGWVTDRSILSFPILMAVSFILQGLIFALIPFSTTFWSYIALLASYGVPSGIIFVYIPVLVHRYVEEENQSIAIGSVGMMSGIIAFGIPPLTGYFRDNVGSYDGLFYLSGFVSILFGIIWFFEPLFLRIKNSNK